MCGCGTLAEAFGLQRRLSEGALQVVAKGVKSDGGTDEKTPGGQNIRKFRL